MSADGRRGAVNLSTGTPRRTGPAIASQPTLWRSLNQLLKDSHTEPYGGADIDWHSWRTFAASLADLQLPHVGLRPELGPSVTPPPPQPPSSSKTAPSAPITPTPSLAALRGWLTAG
ncbi:hypothetical protein [Streptomyces sp. OE57]|uniref:hypothetical protein n=1 Tax=Streptomyces lacaronensis TaxID=3379885 RepID=UPI0039B78F9B